MFRSFTPGSLSRIIAFSSYVLVISIGSHPAYAVPSFTTQTGQSCVTCHVGAFGPQLTDFGRTFKLNGYTLSSDGKRSLPVSLMLTTSLTQTKQNQAPSGGFGPNNNFSLDQISAFYAGAITPSVGAFIQTTYDGVNSVFHWDNADIRYARPGTIQGIDYVAGLSFNNNPTTQDLWNSTPAWSFPYIASALAPTPAASPLLDGALAQQTLGMTAYGKFNDLIYLEAGAYHGLSRNIRNSLGSVPVAGVDTYDGLMPYWRVALEHDFNNQHYVQLGTYGLIANRNPGGIKSNRTDHIVDRAIDANYQWHSFLDHIVSAHASFTHESARLDASSALSGTNPTDRLNSFKTDVSYSYKNTWTPSVQYFNTTGTKDAAYWATSSGLAKPDSAGFVTELAYVPFGKDDQPLPWLNGRLAVQYTAYTKFDGTTQKAAANNTVFVNLWLALDPIAPLTTANQ